MATILNLTREIIDERTEHQGKLKMLNEVVLTIGGVGSGKTTLNSYKAYIRYKKGYTVFNANDWKGIYENCFTCLFPKEKYQLNLLKFQNMIPEQMDTIIYTPFSIDKLKMREKHPETRWFTLPIKSFLGNQMIMMTLFENEKETISMTSFRNIIEKMQNNEGFYDLKYKIEKMPEKQRAEILPRLRIFEKDMFLMPEMEKTNINIKEITNQRKFHSLVDRTIKDRKIKYMILQYFLVELAEKLEDSHYPVILSLDEIKGLMPTGVKNYRARMIDYFSNEIAINSRNKGKGMTIHMAGQQFDAIHKDVRISATDHYFGKIDPDTIKSLKKDFGMNKDQLEPYETLITENKRGRFVRRQHEDDGLFTGFIPPFALPEEGTRFIDSYKEQYPDKYQSYEHFKNEMLGKIKRQRDAYNERKSNDRKAKEKKKKDEEEAKKQKEESTKKIDYKEIELRPDRIALLFHMYKEERDYARKILDSYEKEYGVKLQHVQLYKALKKKKLKTTQGESSDKDKYISCSNCQGRGTVMEGLLSVRCNNCNGSGSRWLGKVKTTQGEEKVENDDEDEEIEQSFYQP